MKFSPIFLAAKQVTGNKQEPFPIYAMMAGTCGKLKFITMTQNSL